MQFEWPNAWSACFSSWWIVRAETEPGLGGIWTNYGEVESLETNRRDVVVSIEESGVIIFRLFPLPGLPKELEPPSFSASPAAAAVVVFGPCVRGGGGNQ